MTASDALKAVEILAGWDRPKGLSFIVSIVMKDSGDHGVYVSAQPEETEAGGPSMDIEVRSIPTPEAMDIFGKAIHSAFYFDVRSN